MRIKWKCVAAALLAGLALVGMTAQADNLVPSIEYNKLIKPLEQLAPLKNDLFGDQVNMYNGQVEFQVTDVSLKGNSALPVALSRRLNIEHKSANTSVGGFAMWDVDVPYLSGTFAGAPYKWDTDYRGSNQRCSTFFLPGAPAQVFVLTDVHKGVQMHIPGGGDQDLMDVKSMGSPVPDDGYPYIWGTRDGTRFQCTASTANGYPGQGFIAMTPDGNRYYFDVGIEKTDLPMTVASFQVVSRVKIYLFASRVEDRFGNWVAYTYDAAGKVVSIRSNDGRQITLGYRGTNIVEAVADGRTWSYQYSATGASSDGWLSRVVYPDGSSYAYDIQLAGGGLVPHYHALDATDSSCPDAEFAAASVVFGATSPSGARGEFTFEYNRQHKTGVPATSCINITRGAYRLSTPDYYDLYSLVSKTLSGPGLPPLTWTYRYSDIGDGRTAQTYPCRTCTAAKWNGVINPDGTQDWTRYGILYAVNDGRMLEKSKLSASGVTVRNDKYSYVTDAEVASQPFPEVYGYMSYDSDRASIEVRPLRLTETTVDGTRFSLRADAYDAFARVTQSTRSGPRATRTDSTVFADDMHRWVLNNIGKESNVDTGRVFSETAYDANALPRQTWTFGKLRQTIGYNTDGTLASIVDGNGNTTTFSAWKRGIPQRIGYADGTFTAASVDDRGWITSIADETGSLTAYDYDAAGRISNILYPAGDSVAWNPVHMEFQQVGAAEYGVASGHWRQVVSNGSSRKETYFDALWRPVVTRGYDAVDPTDTQAFQRFVYDQDGRVTFASYPGVTDALSAGVWTAYDPLGRTTSVSRDSELGLQVTLTNYLADGGIQQIDPLGRTTVTSHQMLEAMDYSLPVAVQKPEGVYLDLTRDSFGKPLVITQRNADSTLSVSRRYVYNPQQELCKSVEPESAAMAYGYDAAGNISWSAAGLGLPAGDSCDADAAYGSGRRIDRTYDARNRLKSLVFGDQQGNQSWSYTADGQPSQVITSSSASQVVNTYVYNRRRLLTGETSEQIGSYRWSVGYAYDGNGAVSGIQYPSGLYVDYAPDALGRPTRAGMYASNVHYYPNGAMRGFTYGNGIVHAMTQNARQLPEHVADAGVLDNTYAYDLAGNVAGIADALDAGRNRTMRYDGLDRLIEATSPAFGGSGVFTYGYDALDNLKAVRIAGGRDYSYWYDSTNRLSNVLETNGATAVGLAYDVQGNLANRNGQQFSFDMGNRLRDIAGKESYQYDAHGLRVASISASAGNILSMYGQDGVLRRQNNERTGKNVEYVYLNGSLLASVSDSTTPGVPVLQAPVYSADGNYRVGWAAVDTAQRYELQEAAATGSWSILQSGPATEWNAAAKPGGIYAYRARACQITACSGWSAIIAVAVKQAPDARAVLSVARQSINGAYLVSWTGVPGASRYELEEQVEGADWKPLPATAALAFAASGKPVGNYAYRVKACNDAGCGEYSNVGAVSVITAPRVAPVLSLAAQNTDGSFPVSWTTVPSATTYRLEERLNEGDWKQLSEQPAVAYQAVGRDYGRYSYRVRACNDAGCSAYSPVVVIDVILVPNVAPVIDAMAANTTGTFQVRWNSIPRAVEYRLEELNGDGSWSQIQAEGAAMATRSGKVSGAYSYRVRGCNMTGCGPYSGIGSVSVLLPPASAPGISVPATSNTGQYGVNWSAVPYAATYVLQESSDGGASWYTYVAVTTTTMNVGVNNEGYTSPRPWMYRVQACNSTGCSPWSAAATIQVYPPALPSPTGFSATTSRNSCSVRWNAVSGATRYEVVQDGILVRSSGLTSYRADAPCGGVSISVRACNAFSCSASVGG